MRRRRSRSPRRSDRIQGGVTEAPGVPWDFRAVYRCLGSRRRAASPRLLHVTRTPAPVPGRGARARQADEPDSGQTLRRLADAGNFEAVAMMSQAVLPSS